MNLSEIPFLSPAPALALLPFPTSPSPSSSSHPPSKLQAYISAPLMQLCHLDCLDVEEGGERRRRRRSAEGEKKNNPTQSLSFVYQENKGLELPRTTALSAVFTASRTHKHALILCLGHIHKHILADSRARPRWDRIKVDSFYYQ